MHMLGQPVADTILARVRGEVAALGRAPHLVIVAATDREESRVYVSQKAKAAGANGMRCTVDDVPEAKRTTDALCARITRWNADDAVDGIIVQLPLARTINHAAVLGAVHPSKDVDGLTPTNLAAAYLGTSGFRAATAAAVLAILDHYDVPLVGAHAVIVGRSRLIGLPLAGMLVQRDATVTVCHTQTRDLAAETRRADVLVVASGKPATVTRAMVAPGATVVDVGWSRVDGRIVGDVATDVAEVAGAITPVPGGVGPVTVAMLLANTLDAAKARQRGEP